jgi:flagellar biosynthesis/type III secretory pathway chaperone
MKHSKEIQKVVQNFINQMDEVRKQKDELFVKLQDASGDRTCCSWDYMLKLLKQKDEKLYLNYYEQLIKLNTKYDIILQFGGELGNAGFWKQEDKQCIR